MIKKGKSNNSDTVVQENTLIRATHKLNKNEILAFKKILSMIDNKYREREVKISKREIIDFIFTNKNNNLKNKYNKVKTYCQKLMETTLDFYTEGTHGKFTSYSLCSKFEWPYKDSYFTIEFSDRIMPYLFELKKCFTQYPIGILQKLRTRNSIRIYEYCRMNLHSKKESFTWVVSLIEFKRILNLENQYPRFNSFRERILEKCVSEINNKTNLHIEFEIVKEYKAVQELIFTVREKCLKTQKEIDANQKLWDENK